MPTFRETAATVPPVTAASIPRRDSTDRALTEEAARLVAATFTTPDYPPTARTIGKVTGALVTIGLYALGGVLAILRMAHIV